MSHTRDIFCFTVSLPLRLQGPLAHGPAKRILVRTACNFPPPFLLLKIFQSITLLQDLVGHLLLRPLGDDDPPELPPPLLPLPELVQEVPAGGQLPVKVQCAQKRERVNGFRVKGKGGIDTSSSALLFAFICGRPSVQKCLSLLLWAESEVSDKFSSSIVHVFRCRR